MRRKLPEKPMRWIGVWLQENQDRSEFDLIKELERRGYKPATVRIQTTRAKKHGLLKEHLHQTTPVFNPVPKPRKIKVADL